jgi:hypothetical protein
MEWKWLDKVSRGISSGLEPMPRTSEALMAQYPNVRQRKLGTIIIQTVQVSISLQHDSAVTGSPPEGKILHGSPNLLSNNLAR